MSHLSIVAAFFGHACGDATARSRQTPRRHLARSEIAVWSMPDTEHTSLMGNDAHYPALDSASVFVALSVLSATMSSGARRHHSPVAACQRLHLGQPVSRSPQWSISTKDWSHCLQRLGMRTSVMDDRFCQKIPKIFEHTASQ
jgi:hypothetical protein